MTYDERGHPLASSSQEVKGNIRQFDYEYTSQNARIPTPNAKEIVHQLCAPKEKSSQWEAKIVQINPRSCLWFS